MIIVPPATVSQHRTTSSPPIPYTAAQWKRALGLFRMQSRADQPPDRNPYPKDSIQKEIALRATQWHNALNTSQSSGMYIDPDVALLVAGESDQQAQAAVANRLADSSLTQEERAYTLFSVVEAFADSEDHNRLAIAANYLAMLDTLSGDVQYWQYKGHETLANALYLANDRPGTVRHAKQAFAYLQNMWFVSRMHFFQSSTGANMYFSAAEVLVSDHGGKGLNELNESVLAATKLPPELQDIKTDSMFIWMSRGYRGYFTGMMRLAAMIGKPAPPVMGHRWLNRADTSAHEETFADGKVRLVGMGRWGSSVYLLPAYGRVAQEVGKSGNFESVFVIESSGYWGSAFVSPEGEMARIVSHFQERRPTTVPIAIWAGEKTLDDEGGMRPTPSPTRQAYAIRRPPTTFLIDGTGRIRRVFERFSRDHEMQAIALIKHLQ